MQLELTDEEVAALLAALSRLIDNDHYPFSPRIRTLCAVRAKLPVAPAEPALISSAVNRKIEAIIGVAIQKNERVGQGGEIANPRVYSMTETKRPGDNEPITEILDRLVDAAESNERISFITLAEAAGLDPSQDFVGASLREIDFRGEDLRGFDFSGGDLTGSDFRRADVSGVRFEGAVLLGVIGLPVSAATPSKTDHRSQTTIPQIIIPQTTTPQTTIQTRIGCRGIGLHSGRKIGMTLLPAAPDTGIIFRRTDADAEIRASWTNAVESPRGTLLSNGEGITVGTIEHLMAALAGAEIDNVIIELNGPEVPIMDGSSAPFLFLIECAGILEQDAPRRAVKVLKPVSVVEGRAMAMLLPNHGFSMSFEIDFDNPLISRQDVSLVFDKTTFKSELSRARIFGLIDEVDGLRAAGLGRGGLLDNELMVKGNDILNAGGLRYADEFVRHKLVRAFGDLYLAGGPIIGRFCGVRSGHAQTRRLLAALFADPEAWCYTSLSGTTDIGSLGREEELQFTSTAANS
jgi:UDP-3-O-[3-hydroxymyristoyl] N-acetylglucosamine deacetylase